MRNKKNILYSVSAIIIGIGIVFLIWKYVSLPGPTKREQVEERQRIVEEINKIKINATLEERKLIVDEINSINR